MFPNEDKHLWKGRPDRNFRLHILIQYTVPYIGLFQTAYIHCILLQYTAPLQCLEKSIRSMGVGTEGGGGPNSPIIQLRELPPPIMAPGAVTKRKKKWKSNWNDLSTVYVAVTFGQNKQFWIQNVCLENLCLCLVAHNVGSWCTFLIFISVFCSVQAKSRTKLAKS